MDSPWALEDLQLPTFSTAARNKYAHTKSSEKWLQVSDLSFWKRKATSFEDWRTVCARGRLDWGKSGK